VQTTCSTVGLSQKAREALKIRNFSQPADAPWQRGYMAEDCVHGARNISTMPVVPACCSQARGHCPSKRDACHMLRPSPARTLGAIRRTRSSLVGHRPRRPMSLRIFDRELWVPSPAMGSLLARARAAVQPKSVTSRTVDGSVRKLHEVMPSPPSCKGMLARDTSGHSSLLLQLASVSATDDVASLTDTSASDMHASPQSTPCVRPRGTTKAATIHSSIPPGCTASFDRDQGQPGTCGRVGALTHFTTPDKPGCTASWCGQGLAARERVLAASGIAPEVALRHDMQLPASASQGAQEAQSPPTAGDRRGSCHRVRKRLFLPPASNPSSEEFVNTN